MGLGGVLLFVGLGIAAGVIVLGFWLQYLIKKRGEALQQVAIRLGFGYVAREKEFYKEYIGLPMFQRGYVRTALHVMRGRRSGKEWTLVDYAYTTGIGKYTRNTSQVVAIVPLEAPCLSLGKKWSYQPTGWWKDSSKIDMSYDPVIAKTYYLRAQQAEPALAFLKGVVEVLHANRLSIESDGRQVAIYRWKRPKPAEYSHFIREVEQVLSAIKR